MVQPPFQQQESLFSNRSPLPPQTLKLIFPVLYQNDDRSYTSIKRARTFDFLQYLKQDLDVARLNKIHKHLWLAGLPRPVRTLHHQVLTGRKIIITERADLHLVWQEERLFLKPLPEYLMDYDIWEEFLTISQAVFEDACGFLLSYVWLICHKSDLRLAHDEGLIGQDVTWEHWTTFCEAAVSGLGRHTLRNINPRYLYGELRLDRINTIYRFCSQTTSFTILTRGYQYGYHDYSTFVKRNFAWVLTAIIYITIVLTAMQVGLATSELQENKSFKRASYGFSIFSIIAPLIVLGIAVFLVLLLVLFNLKYALGERSHSRKQYSAIFENVRLQESHSLRQ